MGLTKWVGRLLGYMVLHPRPKRPHRDPGDFGLPWTEEIVETSDGFLLTCWLVGAESDSIAVVGHGIAQGKSASLQNAKFLLGEGYQVLMFDHRGHGDSQRDRRVWNVADRFTDDIVSCVNWVRRRSPSKRVVVCGFSFSTFPTIYGLASGSLAVQGVICESGPGLGLVGMFDAFLTQASKQSTPLGRLMRSQALRHATAESAVLMLGASWPPDAQQGTISSVPQLYLVGDDDTVISPNDVRQLTSDWPRARVCELDGGHLRLIRSDPAGYAGAVSGFIREME